MAPSAHVARVLPPAVRRFATDLRNEYRKAQFHVMSLPLEEELDPAAKRSPLKGGAPKGRMGRRGTQLRGAATPHDRRRHAVHGMSHGFEAADLGGGAASAWTAR